MMTQEQLHLALPFASIANVKKYLAPLNLAMEKFGINTPGRIAIFLAQGAHESDSLQLIEENLNYSSSGLLKIFPKYFTPEQAAEYAHKPQMIANRVYANRMGNGDEASGDGWNFRGKGIFQITGKENHDNCGVALNYDFVKDPEGLLKPGAAALSAGWFWFSRGLNALADADSFLQVSKRINGVNRATGLPNGYDDRLDHWKRTRKAFGI